MKQLRPTIILILIVVTESYNRLFTAKTAFSNNNVKTIPSKHARMMFSGIVEDVGSVEILKVNPKMVQWDGSVGEGVELTVKSKLAVDEAYIGCSIAVNGVCLTAISFDDNQFTVGLAPETLRRSNLGQLLQGSKVNVERAMKADSRNSGHFVQGHVDCTGDIIEKFMEGDSMWFKIQVPTESIPYIVPKGFICIDGTSLTICEVDNKNSWFTFMLINHTQQNVIIPFKEIGEKVNVEVDVLAKMVERSLKGVYDNTSTGNTEVEDLKKRVADLEMVVNKLVGIDLPKLKT